MAEEKAQSPFSDMTAFWANWEKMTWESFETMMKAPAFTAGLGKAFESSTALQEQIQKNIQAGLQAMNLPTIEDLRRITVGISAMEARLDAIRVAFETVETTMRLQEEWRKGVDQTIRQLVAFQEEGRKVFKTWTDQMDERFKGFQRLWEEATRR
ncbi:MAG TPA: hypothetical protein VFM04_00680 [Candidatus Methylomirabilis sp.]|nr:hypothetical protein [Candidatus Methylomirabilis sp.]